MGYFRARLSSFSLSLPLLAVVGFTVGCGDNAPGNPGTGGAAGSSTGGVGGGSGGTGGGTGGVGGGSAGTSGETGGVGGATGGVGGVGGAVSTGGVGGGTGGVGGKGGVGGGTGGVGGGIGGVGGGTGGTVSTGGVGGGTGGVGGGTGGTVSTGGVGGGTGGTVSTGGVGGGTGGTVSTGGVGGGVDGGIGGVDGEVDGAAGAGGMAGAGGGTGTTPVVTFTNPQGGAMLCGNGSTVTGCVDDNDTGTSGWQGTLAVHVTSGGSNVVGSLITFTDGATIFGSATTDTNGNAQIAGISIAEGAQTLTATTDNVPGAGVGTVNANVTVDTIPPNPPTGLSAEIPSSDPTARRKVLMQLSWTAPSDIGGGNVAGYQFRYAMTAIVTDEDFAAATSFPDTTPPKNAGDPDGLPVSPLYIETNYYFAVAATDAFGNMSSFVAIPPGGICDCTSGRCCAAHFLTATLTGTAGSTEGAGYTIDGSGDSDGDGLSDVLVGSYNGSQAYLCLGSSNFGPTAPDVVFSSAVAGFGRGVAYIGDIDHDGHEDLAIANTATNVVYIYRGRDRTTNPWPLTMADTDADFTITADSSYAASLFGSSMTRLGDFDGDGVDDFAIGSPNYGPTTFAGRVTVILGASGFTSVSLGSTSRAITISGTAIVGQLGTRVLGVGPFYSPTGTTELIVSAPGFTGFASSTGAIYAFRGQAATGGAIPLASADASIAGASAGMSIGTFLADLGAVTTGLPPRIGCG